MGRIAMAAREKDYMDYDDDVVLAEDRQSGAYTPSSAAQLEVVLDKPACMEDAGAIADHFDARHIHVINLEEVTPALSRRLRDFLSGIAYGKGGRLVKVSEKVSILAPGTVDVLNKMDCYDDGADESDTDFRAEAIFMES